MKKKLLLSAVILFMSMFTFLVKPYANDTVKILKVMNGIKYKEWKTLSTTQKVEFLNRVSLYKNKGNGKIISYSNGNFIMVKQNEALKSWYNKNRSKKLSNKKIYDNYLKEVKSKRSIPYSDNLIIVYKKKKVSKVSVSMVSKPITLMAAKRGRKVNGVWKSNNDTIASVDTNGRVTPNKGGTTELFFEIPPKDYNGVPDIVSIKIDVTIPLSSIRFKDPSTNKYTKSVIVDLNSTFTPVVVAKPTKEAVKKDIDISFDSSKFEFTAYTDMQLEDEIDLYDNDLFMEENHGTFSTLSEEGTIYLVTKYNGVSANGNILRVDIVDKEKVENLEKLEAERKERDEADKKSKADEAERKKKQEEEKKKEDERKAKELADKAAKEAEKSMPQRIEISTNATITQQSSNGVNYANITFKVFDGNGKDITNTGLVNSGNTTVKFKRNDGSSQGFEQSLSITGLGYISLPIFTNVINPIGGTSTPIGYSGTVTMEYRKIDNTIVKFDGSIVVVPPAKITRAEILGIYKATFQNGSYEEVLSRAVSKLKKDDTISNYGGVESLNTIPGSHYLLIDAYDSFNAQVTRAGVEVTELNIAISGNSSIQLDNVFYNGASKIASIKPIVVNGREYLTFPIKAVDKVTEGTLNITIGGRASLTKAISDGSRIVTFIINVPNAFMNRDNILLFTLTTTNGNVTSFEQVVGHLGLAINPGQEIIPLIGTGVIESNKGSIFTLRRGSDGNAQLYYQPSPSVLTNFAIPDNPTGTDTVTIFKGRGLPLEMTIPINVTTK